MSNLIDIKITSKKVYLDFGEIQLKISPKTYENLNLILGNDYDPNEIKIEDKINEIYDEIVKKLSKKLYSSYEVKKSLENKRIIDDKSIDKIMNRLLDEHYLDDSLFAELYTKELNKDYYGKYQIINELRRKGINASIIESLDFKHETELQKAQTYFKLISNKYASNNFAKQKRKIYNELLKHGFDIDIINSIINEIPLIEEKEIEKLYKDYSKIKSKLGIYGVLNDLNEGKIISALIKMGYSYSDINDLITREKKND